MVTRVNSEGDTIDYQRFSCLQSYLAWRMECKARNNRNSTKRAAGLRTTARA